LLSVDAVLDALQKAGAGDGAKIAKGGA